MSLTATQPGIPFGVIHRRLTTGRVVPYTPTAQTDAKRGEILRSSLLDLAAGEQLLIGPGTYTQSVVLEFDYTMPIGASLIGSPGTIIGTDRLFSKIDMADGCTIQGIDFLPHPMQGLFRFPAGDMTCVFRDLVVRRDTLDDSNNVGDVFRFPNSGASGTKRIYVHDSRFTGSQHCIGGYIVSSTDVKIYLNNVSIDVYDSIGFSTCVRSQGNGFEVYVFGGNYHADESSTESTRALFSVTSGKIFAFGAKLSSFDSSGTYWDAQVQSNGEINLIGCDYDPARISGTSGTITSTPHSVTTPITLADDGQLGLDLTTGYNWTGTHDFAAATTTVVGMTASANIGCVDLNASGDVGCVGVNASGNVGCVDLNATGNLSGVDVNATGDLVAVDGTFSGIMAVGDAALDANIAINVAKTIDVPFVSVGNAQVFIATYGQNSGAFSSMAGYWLQVHDEAAASSALQLDGLAVQHTISHTSGTHTLVNGIRVEPLYGASAAGTITTLNGVNVSNLTAASFGETFVDVAAFYVASQDAGTLALNNNSSADNHFGNDNSMSLLGTGDDAGFEYDGSDLIIDSALVGSGRTKFNHALALKPATLAEITSSHIDYDLGNNTIVRLSAAVGPFGIRGFVAGRPGELHILVNVGANDFVINHQSGSEPTPANRIITLTGADVTLTPNDQMTVWYDDTTQRWRES